MQAEAADRVDLAVREAMHRRLKEERVANDYFQAAPLA
jgi:hypothetical protein